jgi:hypothetical protein
MSTIFSISDVIRLVRRINELIHYLQRYEINYLVFLQHLNISDNPHGEFFC